MPRPRRSRRTQGRQIRPGSSPSAPGASTNPSALRAEGRGLREIARHLGWGLHTVQRYDRAATWQELAESRWPTERPSKLDPFKPYLDKARPAKAPLGEAPPTVRDVTNWLCRRSDTLAEDERPRLKAILDRCPEIQAASGQVRAFATMITDLTGQDLPQWMAAAREAGLPGISSFAKGLEQDLDAVTQGLTTSWAPDPSKAASTAAEAKAGRQAGGGKGAARGRRGEHGAARART